MDYYLIYYYLLLLTLLLSLLLLLLLLLLHHLYARVPALHSTAFNCTILPAMKKEIYTIYTTTAAEQPPSPTISVYDIHFHLSAGGTYRGTARLRRRQLKFHSLFTFSYLVLFVYFVGKYQQLAPKKEETLPRDCKVTHAKWLMMPSRVKRMQRIVIRHYNSIATCV